MSNNQLLIFENHGEIDSRLITTLGVNVKADSASAIGYFGTGLKYGLATALRLGCRVEIHSGLTTYSFGSQKEMIRGKEFELITMTDSSRSSTTPVTLGFTTDLGKNWLPWMAFREFECNALDEGGSSRLEWESLEPTEGLTRVVISGSALVEEFWKKDEWMLKSKPLLTGETAELHPARGRGVFYRGLKVAELMKSCLFAYNIKTELRLTEDRTIRDFFAPMRAIAATVAESDNCEVIGKMICPPRDSWEFDLDWQWTSVEPSECFAREVLRSSISRPASTSPSAISLAKARFPKMFEEEIEEAELTPVEARMLEKAKKFLKEQIGIKLANPIVIVEQLGDAGTLGMAKDGKIWIARETLAKGTKMLAGTLLEEHLHLQQHLSDFSRGLQNWLIDKVVSMGEELQGEPL